MAHPPRSSETPLKSSQERQHKAGSKKHYTARGGRRTQAAADYANYAAV